MEYAKKDQIILTNKTGFDISNIQEISKEVLEKKEFKVQEIEIFKTAVAISANEITEEEKTKIIEKVNEKYGLEIAQDDIKIQTIEQTRIKDILKPYILPSILTLAIILFYFIIRYRKIGIAKVLMIGILMPIISELLLYSIVLICRIPLGDITKALSIGIYACAVTIIATIFEKENKKNDEKLENK